MIGQARFTYTDDDMIATQRAGWRWGARWPILLIAYGVVVVLNSALLLGLNLTFGTRPVPADPYFVVISSAVEVTLLFGLFFVMSTLQGRNVLHKTQRATWDGDALDGEQTWAWDANAFHVAHDRGRADLAWTAVGAWLDAPKVLLLLPAGGKAFSLPEPVLAAGWRNAPKVFFMPQGGYALALPKRALAAGDADRLVDLLRATGARERRAFGLIAAKAVTAS